MDPFARLSERELMFGFPVGLSPSVSPLRAGLAARAALESVIRPKVTSGLPCYVLFSGGRDSSAILALAADLARRNSVPDPVPVTAVYPGVEGADESYWQRLVLDHLRIDARVTIPITDERRHLGEPARRNLRRRGLVWPAGVQTQDQLVNTLEPGVVLTGEGGDEFLERRRVTPLLLLKTTRGRPSRALLREVAGALEPRWIRRRRERWDLRRGPTVPWLRSGARRDLFRGMTQVQGRLRWDTELWSLLSQRSTQVAMRNSSAVAAEYGHVMTHPLSDPRFIAGLARDGGRWGFRGRTDVFRRLFGDLLPDELLARRTKAYFNESRWGEAERDFAASWDGTGLDDTVIDGGVLRQEWLKDSPDPRAAFLAQVAWYRSTVLTDDTIAPT